MTWRLVVFSSMLLLGQSFASQSTHLNADYNHCGGNNRLIANGVCDESVNTADCGFDGGDCCECTCVLRSGAPCEHVEASYSCRDPDAPTSCHSIDIQTRISTASLSYPECEGYTPYIRDGRCNEANNNADCGFDGGDCCASTCVGGLAHVCGGDNEGGFDCKDPRGISPRRRLNSASCGGAVEDIGNTRCDSSLNNFECGYDGGDCCECTCWQDLTDWNISDDITNYCLDGDFDCLDPSANCDSSTEPPTPGPTPSPSICQDEAPFLGDGVCDYVTNIAACDWDGGDCCECTCDQSARFGCPDFTCLDPNAPRDCESSTSVPSPTGSFVPSPTGSSVPSSTAGPVTGATSIPIQSSTGSPVTSPTEFPVAGSTDVPVPGATEPPEISRTESPVSRSTESPVLSPIESPVPSPTASPLSSPTESPVASATERPFSGPTESPVPGLTGSPVPVATLNPVLGPTESPVQGTSERPVLSTTGSPLPRTTTVNPAQSTTATPAGSDSPPVQSDSGTDSDTIGDSDSSTESRGIDGEGASASSACLIATMGASIAVFWRVVVLFNAFVLGYCTC